MLIETTMPVTCKDTAVWLRAHQVTEMLNDYKHIVSDMMANPQYDTVLARATQWQIRWEQFLRDESMEDTCGWEGETDVQIMNGTVVFTCPGCGREQEFPDEQDPDVADRLRDQGMEDRSR